MDRIIDAIKSSNQDGLNEQEEEESLDDEKKNLFRTILSFILTSFDLIRSIFIRVVFAIHSLAAISLVCYQRNDLWYFVNSIGIIFIAIEWFVIALKNDGKDLPWFSPSFCIYIATLIPPTWFLELENIKIKVSALESITNGTISHGQQHISPHSSLIISNTSFVSGNNVSTEIYYDTDLVESVVPLPLLPGEIKSVLAGAAPNFAMYIEVTMMLIIIVGRWMMPKKGITRSELSQLLLVYMSLASDIIDLLSVLQEQKIMTNKPMVYVTLSVYSWSLFQFTLNLVVTRGRSSGSAGSLAASTNSGKSGQSLNNGGNGLSASSTDKKRAKNSINIHNELWNVMITLIMQDGPFFILRTVCVFKFDIVSYLFLFFTFKNGILFSLQIYRIIAICTDKDYNFDPASESSTNSNVILISNLLSTNTNELGLIGQNNNNNNNFATSTGINFNKARTKSEIFKPIVYEYEREKDAEQRNNSCDY